MVQTDARSACPELSLRISSSFRTLSSLESYLGRLRRNTCSRCRDGSQAGKTRA